MSRSWMGVALALACVGWALPASAQHQAMPEPVPFAPSSAPHGPPPSAGLQMTPGPLSPQMAPQGPPPELTLPASLPGAFQEPPAPQCGSYFYLGTRALQRNGLGSGPTASIDRDNRTRLDTGDLPRSARFLRPVQRFDDVDMNMAWGVDATWGWYDDNTVLELSGFYIPQNSTFDTISNPGRLFVYFNPAPLGFEGNNGMWRQADVVSTSYQSAIGNVEVNYRWWNRGVDGFEPSIGLRYFDLMERVSIYTGDDDISVRDINNLPDPRRQANYSVRGQNRIVAPQLGAEWNRHFLSHFSIGLMAKAAWGVNFVNVEQTLTRGDGFAPKPGRRDDIIFSHIYEFGAHIDLYLLERLRVRAGYTALLLLDVSEAVDQINFNLRNPTGSAVDDGNIFYHGPTIQVQMLF
jgi:hypothetical protein